MANGYRPISSDNPTYWLSDIAKIPDLLDSFITKGIATHLTNIQDNYNLSSDHSPLILTLPTTTLLKEKKLPLQNSSTDWVAFRDYLNDHIKFPIPLRTSIGIDEAVQKLTERLQHAAWIATPRTKLLIW